MSEWRPNRKYRQVNSVWWRLRHP